MKTRVDSLRKGWIESALFVMIEEAWFRFMAAGGSAMEKLSIFVLDSPLKGSIYTPFKGMKKEDCE